MNENFQNLLEKLVDKKLDFSILEYENNKKMRIALLESILKKKYSTFFKDLKIIVNDVQHALKSDEILKDSNYWSTVKGMNEAYWRKDQEIRDIIHQHMFVSRQQPDAKSPQLEKNPGVIGTISPAINDDYVKILVGNAYWMTLQQRILFCLLTFHYYKPERNLHHHHLLPVYMNMDFTYRQKLRQNQKKRVVDENTHATRYETFVIFLKSLLAGAGPFILKMLQMVGNSNEKKLLDNDLNDLNEDWCISYQKKLNVESKKSHISPESVKIDANITNSTFHRDVFGNIYKNATDWIKINLLKGLDIKEITQDVYDCVPTLEPEEYRLLTQSFDLRDCHIESIQENVLGSASIAEAHEVSIEYQDQRVPGIIKFVKPLNLLHFLCECYFLLTIAWAEIPTIAVKEYQNSIQTIQNSVKYSRKEWANQSLADLKIDDKFMAQCNIRIKHLPPQETLIKQCRQLILFFIIEYAKEFDYETESRNTLVGHHHYHNCLPHIHSVNILNYRCDPAPFILLGKIEGITLSKLLNQDNDDVFYYKSYTLLCDFCELWLQNALFGDGFIHADLHPGNIMVTRDKKNMYIIDYGSCGQVPLALIKNLICSMIEGSRYIKPFKKKLVYDSNLKQHVLSQLMPLVTNSGSILKWWKTQEDIYRSKPKHLKKLRRVITHLLHLETKIEPTDLTWREVIGFDTIHYIFHYATRPIETIKSQSHLRGFDPQKHDAWDFELDGDPRTHREFYPYHLHNMEVARRFVLWIWKLCNTNTNLMGESYEEAKANTESHLNVVADSLLTYECGVYPNIWALNVIKNSRDVGNCMNGELFFVGRATAYLGSILETLFNTCKRKNIAVSKINIEEFIYRILKKPQFWGKAAEITQYFIKGPF
jgi:hypothetical protein